MNKKNIHNIKSPGFKVPDKYFSQVEEHIINELNLHSKTETSGFEVPKTYFEDIDQKILKRIAHENDTKVIPLFTWKNTTYAAAVAACLILMFNILWTPSESPSFETLEMASIENYLDQEELSSHELVSLLTEDELNSNNFIDDEFPEGALEDYLLDNVDLENLIIEQ